jgi:hypothetical protein
MTDRYVVDIIERSTNVFSNNHTYKIFKSKIKEAIHQNVLNEMYEQEQKHGILTDRKIALIHQMNNTFRRLCKNIYTELWFNTKYNH